MDNDHSITDELRSFIKDPLLGYASQEQHVEQLTAIADRIDKALAERYVELPKGADGEYIHVGDRLEHTNGIFTANDMTISIDGIWRAWDGENGHTVLLAKCRHHKQPTVEDTLREFADKWLRTAEGSENEDAVVAEYAAKLRLAGSDAE